MLSGNPSFTSIDSDGGRISKAASSVQNRRADPRLKIPIRAEAVLPDGVVECRVRDLSQGGALLAVDEADRLPARFSLRIGESRKALRVAVQEIRRGEVAVRFVTTG